MLGNNSVNLLTSFRNNGMKANADICHLLLNSKNNVRFEIWWCNNKSSEQQKFLGTLHDNISTPGAHVNNLCAKANERLNSLWWVFSFISTYKKRLDKKHLWNFQLLLLRSLWLPFGNHHLQYVRFPNRKFW